MCYMAHAYVWHDSFISVTWLIHMCDMTHSYVWHDSFTCDMTHSYVWHDSFTPTPRTQSIHAYICDMTQLSHVTYIWMGSPFHICDMTHVGHALFSCVTWLIHMGHDLRTSYTHSQPNSADQNQKRVRGGSFICGKWFIHMGHYFYTFHIYPTQLDILKTKRISWRLIHMWDMTHLYVGHASFICGTWHMWDMTDLYVGHASFICGHDSFICGTWIIDMWDMTHLYVGHELFICGMWDMNQLYVGHDSFVCGTWIIPKWDMTHTPHV